MAARLAVQPCAEEVMIMFLNKIREWNHRRLAQRADRRILSDLKKLKNDLQNLSQAVQDPNGLGMARFRMRMLHCPEEYEYMLCATPPRG